jgi:hypothetical protein
VDAADALARIEQQGVPEGAVSVIPKHVNQARELGLRAATKAPEGAVLGGVGGAVLGGALASLLAAGAIVVPRLGAVLAGRVVAALAGAFVFGVIGALFGALAGARRPEFEATLLRDAVALGGALVSVRCAEHVAPGVAATLEGSGADRVRSTAYRS